jgi:hypothetical protein
MRKYVAEPSLKIILCRVFSGSSPDLGIRECVILDGFLSSREDSEVPNAPSLEHHSTLSGEILQITSRIKKLLQFHKTFFVRQFPT